MIMTKQSGILVTSLTAYKLNNSPSPQPQFIGQDVQKKDIVSIIVVGNFPEIKPPAYSTPSKKNKLLFFIFR